MTRHLDQIKLTKPGQARDLDEASGPKRDIVRQAGPAPELAALLPPMARPALHRLPNSALRRLAGDDAYTVSDAFEQELQSERSGGRPLDQATSQRFGATLGDDLSDIRVHTGSTAAHLASAIQARAFTHGRDIYFADGEFNPQSARGQFTLAHELAHATDVQDRVGAGASGRLVVGATHDPAEARADATARSALQALRRQVAPEEEEEKEEAIRPLRRQVEGDEEEEELQPLRRRVDVDVTMQTITEEAVHQMTTVELREQLEMLQTGIAISDVRESNQPLIEAELARREAEIEAATLEDLDRQCGRELDRLQRWMLSPGGLALQTLRAYDGAVGNFVDFAGVSTSGGMQFSDVFGIVLAFVPGVGPVARWVGQEAMRAAPVAAAQAAAEAAVERGAAIGTEAGTAAEQRARAEFAAQVRGESAALADALARSVDGVLTTHENAVDIAHRARNVDAVRSLLINIQHLNDEARSVDLARFAELGRRFEIELYRRHFAGSGRLIEHIAPYTSQHLRYEVEGIPGPVLDRLLGRGGLNAAANEEQLARDWGFPRRILMDLPRGGRGR